MNTHSYNAKLEYTTVGGSSYTEVAGCKNLDGPKAKVTSSKATKLRSTAATAEKVAGFIDEGQLSFDAIFDATQFGVLRGFLRLNKQWRMTFNDSLGVSGSTLVFVGFITELGTAVPEDDVITQPCTIDVTGVVTFTPAS
jgi:hypothetical protein